MNTNSILRLACLLGIFCATGLCLDIRVITRIIPDGGVLELGANGESAVPAARAPSGVNPATLRWTNGESILGEPAESSATDLTWKSPLFETPLVLKWSALRRIEREIEPLPSEEPFSITLRDGSHLLGDVVAVSDDVLTIRSKRCGEVALKRTEIISARRLSGGNLIAAGPAGESQWRVLADTTATASALAAKVPLIKTGPAGSLVLPYWNRGAILKISLPELVDVEFRVRAERRPDFRLSIGAGGTDRLRVESWDEDLVLVSGSGFMTIGKLVDGDREVALRILWDRNAHRCSVFTPDGEQIVDWSVPPDGENVSNQVTLENKGRSLSLEFLRVRKWDGQAPTKISGKMPRLELADGKSFAGKIGAGGEGKVSLKQDDHDVVSSYSLSDVEGFVFSSDRPQTADSTTTLVYADSTLIHGSLVSIKDGRAVLATAFSDSPINPELNGLRLLSRSASSADGETPDASLAEMDVLLLPNQTLHGRLASSGDANLRWLPVGGVTPSLLAKNVETEVRRAIPETADTPRAAALFYLATGDVLPGHLLSIDREGVEIESNIVDLKKLPAELLNAVQFGDAAQRVLRGFGDSAWRIVKGKDGSARKTDDALSLGAGSAIGHPSLLHCAEVRFALVPSNFGAVRLRLFCAGTDVTASNNLLLGFSGNRFYFGLEEAEGQMDDQQQIQVESGKPVIVRLLISATHVELHLNEVMEHKFAIGASKRAGTGLVFESAGLWGNREETVSVKDLLASSGVGRAWLPEVSPDAKVHALTVPRFRKDYPARQVLLAMNGDVLRGEIEATTPTHLGFRSGIESLRVPRDRVKAAIWLKPEKNGIPSHQAQDLPLKLLQERLRQGVSYGSSSVNAITDMLKREVAGLKFKLPPQGSNTRLPFRSHGQTVAEALDEICGMFGLSYSIEGDTLVLTKGQKAKTNLVEKTYWIKNAVFPADGSPQEILSQKGVSFPPDSAIAWQAHAGQLTMINSPDNHEKLARVLAADFGGVIGSPTHWILLTSGARLGFAVERFDPDAVVGTHPVYGRCRVPLSSVHTIRTTAAEPTPAMQSLADWHLIYAPEPVLPETGGESSPMLGMVAADFKVPLLSGGDFQLAKQRGKVVVLDFWATWCGPCIKSLPALIDSMSAFPADRVTFLGVNQSETGDQVKRFLEARGWKFPVALDAGQKVARQFGVEGIPHTVIIGPDGSVAWVKSGYSPEGASEAADAVKRLLPGSAPVAK